jgi:hypothetical protein
VTTRKPTNSEVFDKTTLMIHNIVEIGNNIRAVDKIIFAQPKSYKVPHDYKEPENQVFFLDQKMVTEVKNLTGKPALVFDLVNYYLDWSKRTLDLFEKNKDNLWNKNLRDALYNYHGYVITIRQTLESSFKNSSFDWRNLLDGPDTEQDDK